MDCDYPPEGITDIDSGDKKSGDDEIQEIPIVDSTTNKEENSFLAGYNSVQGNNDYYNEEGAMYNEPHALYAEQTQYNSSMNDNVFDSQPDPYSEEYNAWAQAALHDLKTNYTMNHYEPNYYLCDNGESTNTITKNLTRTPSKFFNVNPITYLFGVDVPKIQISKAMWITFTERYKDRIFSAVKPRINILLITIPELYHDVTRNRIDARKLILSRKGDNFAELYTASRVYVATPTMICRNNGEEYFKSNEFKFIVITRMELWGTCKYDATLPPMDSTSMVECMIKIMDAAKPWKTIVAGTEYTGNLQTIGNMHYYIPSPAVSKFIRETSDPARFYQMIHYVIERCDNCNKKPRAIVKETDVDYPVIVRCLNPNTAEEVKPKYDAYCFPCGKQYFASIGLKSLPNIMQNKFLWF